MNTVANLFFFFNVKLAFLLGHSAVHPWASSLLLCRSNLNLSSPEPTSWPSSSFPSLSLPLPFFPYKIRRTFCLSLCARLYSVCLHFWSTSGHKSVSTPLRGDCTSFFSSPGHRNRLLLAGKPPLKPATISSSRRNPASSSRSWGTISKLLTCMLIILYQFYFPLSVRPSICWF